MGMFNTDWDVDKYKNGYESDEHWNLRRQFMVAHKQKYPEMRLVCLTQVFFNMEFLGCKYPEKTMDLVNKLAGEVAEEFRESRKDKLKRTFVGAKDAAGAKVTGAKPPTGTVEGSDAADGGPTEKKARIEEEEEEECTSQEAGPASQSAKVGDVKQYEEAVKEIAKTFVLMIPTRTNSKTEGDPMNIIHKNFHHKQVSIRFSGGKQEGGWICEISVNPNKDGEKSKMVIASSVGSTQRQAKYQAAQMAIDSLKKHCTYLIPNPEWFQEGGTPEFFQKRLPCNRDPRTYLIMRKEDTGHVSPEVADLLLDNFKRSSNEDMFFPNDEYKEAEKIQLMNRCTKFKLGFRHFGERTMMKHHHICIFKQKAPSEIVEQAQKMGGKHPKYLIHYKE